MNLNKKQLSGFLLAIAIYWCSILSALVMPLAIASALVGSTATFYGFAYQQMFTPTEEFNICELKKHHFTHFQADDGEDLVVRRYARFFASLSKHFWASEHAPVCIHDLQAQEQEPSSPPTAITLDIIKQAGLQSHVAYAFDLVPASFSSYFGLPSTVEELYSKADTYIAPLLERTSWYDAATSASDDDNNNDKAEDLPTHAYVSFQDFMKWSIDYIYDTYGEKFVSASSFWSQYKDTINSLGVDFFVMAEQVDSILKMTLSDNWLPERTTIVIGWFQDFTLYLVGTLQQVAAEAIRIFESCKTHCFPDPTALGCVAWLAALCIVYIGPLLKWILSFTKPCLAISWYITRHWIAPTALQILRERGPVILCVMCFGGCVCALKKFVWEPRHRQQQQQQQQQNQQQQQRRRRQGDIDLYAVLGVARDATTAAIRRRYRRLSTTCHPDKVQGNEALFLKITEARDILCDDELRPIYDTQGYQAAVAALAAKQNRN